MKFWTGSFGFLDATSTDTPVFEETTRQSICDLAPSFDIKDRFKKALEFRDYLEWQWFESHLHTSYYDFPSIVQLQSRTFDAVAGSIKRKRSRPKEEGRIENCD